MELKQAFVRTKENRRAPPPPPEGPRDKLRLQFDKATEGLSQWARRQFDQATRTLQDACGHKEPCQTHKRREDWFFERKQDLAIGGLERLKAIVHAVPVFARHQYKAVFG